MRNLFLKLSITASLPLMMMVGEAFAASDAHHGDAVEHGGEMAAHGADHASSAGLPQMDPTWFPSQIFWLAVTFFALYFIFAKKTLPALSNTIEGRREHIQNDLDMAEQLNEEAGKVHAAYEEILGKARQESSNLFARLDQDIKSDMLKKTEKFREDSLAQVKTAEANIDKAKAKAKEDMHGVAAEIASRAAEKIIGVSTDLKQAQNVIENISKKAA